MINRCMGLLLDELLAEGIPDLLHRSFTLAAIWDDLSRIAGEGSPAALDSPLGVGSRPRRAPLDIDDRRDAGD